MTPAAPGISDAVWADVLAHVRLHHPVLARGWFVQLQPGTFDRGELTVLAANDAQHAYLRDHCLTAFVEAAQAATGRLVSVRFATAADSAVSTPAGSHPATPSPTPRPPDPDLAPLNPEYTFDNFVVGPCNRLPHASCIAVSDAPGSAYNPLFLHGSAGLGKTHLLQAVYHRVLDRSPSARILYLSCETFVNQFIDAVERGALDGFRYRYRHLDLLLLDDIQFLPGGDRSQEEFFHTFNTLYQLRKQIILSADSAPAEIPNLEERLVSRFNCGLVVRLEPPCLETRLAIIRKKSRMRNIELPEDVALYIASRLKSNTRELEGAINKIHSLAQLDQRRIDLQLAKEAIGAENASRNRQVRIQDIMGAVTQRYNVKLSDLQGRRRTRSVALPRQVGMYLARQLTPHSLGEIGGFFGGRDHTTVLHAHKLINRRRERDLQFRAELDDLERSLTGD